MDLAESWEWLVDAGWPLQLFWTLVVFVIIGQIIGLIRRTLERAARLQAKRRKLDEKAEKALVGRTRPMVLLARVGGWVVFLVALTTIWAQGAAVGGILAGAGFMGLVVGLAAQNSLSNVIAGFTIFFQQPFDIGDWVEIDTVMGTIEDVGLGTTVLVTFDNEKISFPNRIVEGARIKNFTHVRKLRRRLLVGVEYGSRLGTAMATLVQIAKEHPEILDDPEPIAVSIGFGASSVDLELRFWVDPVASSAMKIQTDLIHTVHDTFRAAGIVIAFPHMQVVQAEPWDLVQRQPAPAGEAADQHTASVAATPSLDADEPAADV